MVDKPLQVMLLTTPQTYRTEAFKTAAGKLGIEIVQAIDMPKRLSDQWKMRQGPVATEPFDFSLPELAVSEIVAYAQKRPLAAIMAVDDAGAVLAAMASQALGLPHNAIEAADAARNKYIMRQMLDAGNVASPPFRRFHVNKPKTEMAAQVADEIGFPCVVKPLHLNGSRGVIRANNEAELITAATRVSGMLQNIGDEPAFLIEKYIPGIEVALEGVLHNGRLQVLALFDKPDPLIGPFFEETIYVTPSRLPDEVQSLIAETSAAGAKALGLQTGSVHSELRVNESGAWIVEVNGRSIGGLCSQSLRFDMFLGDSVMDDAGMSLEELLLRQACGLDVSELLREQRASGVMMIPIPHGGILRSFSGLDAAKAVPGIDDVTITSPINNRLVPLPEGESYLGFIFASGNSPEEVESALRQAHGYLIFEIDEEIPLTVRHTPY